MPSDIATAATILHQRHPWWQEMNGTDTAPWRRYRDFSGDLDSVADRRRWLPQGSGEPAEDYALRVRLAELLAWSGPAIDRMAGRLTKDPAAVTYQEDDAPPEAVQEFVAAFLKNADGAGRSLASWWGDFEADVLRMGIGFAEVARDGEDGLPFLVQWLAEECVDWGVDSRGELTYAVLYRRTDDRTSWDASRLSSDHYRVLTRTDGFDFVRPGESSADGYETRQEWTHGLGVVPLVPVYARRVGPMRGRSYVDQISSADLAAYRLLADQFHCSWLHANPLLAKWGTRPADTLVNVGINRIQHLNAGGSGSDREDIRYITFDSTGMEVRRAEIAAIQAQALQASGIDPSLATVGQGGSARSGASIAWSFSTAEEPALNAFTEELDAADRKILEIVHRYFIGGDEASWRQTFQGSVARPKKWTLGSEEEAIQRVVDSKAAVPDSPRFHVALEQELAARLAAGRGPEEVRAILDEIKESRQQTPPPELIPDAVGGTNE